MFIDRAKVFIKAGKGGDGSISFYTEKYVSNGGPDGGDGGKGGDIIFEADSNISSLLDFQFSQHFRAEDGYKGAPKYCHGKNGKDLIIKVPTGTVLRDEETSNIIADLFYDKQTVRVLEGGTGGKGNARFKSSRRRAPHFAQSGADTEEKCVILELKTIADVGLVGYPNVGKSTLLSVISNARPKISDYHFTTLSPNLGVVRYYDHSFVVADIPGLIEGASSGTGLGHDFLRHIERTRLIVHVIDISGREGRDPIDDYKKINSELKAYSKVLYSLPQIVVLNKADLLDGTDIIKNFKRHTRKKVVVISAVSNTGIEELKKAIYETLSGIPPLKPLSYSPFVYERKDTKSFEVLRNDDGSFEVLGGMIDELFRNVVLSDYDSMRYFQKKLKESGIIKSLKKAGAKDGDIVRMMDIEFDFTE